MFTPSHVGLDSRSAANPTYMSEYEIQLSHASFSHGAKDMPNTCRIISNPEILGGKPVIEGTRISVELILTRLGEGRSVQDILSEYPQLTTDQVRTAIEYARAMVSRAVSEAAE
jgi:uncharacterized protein (DUF433 family)